MGSSECSGTTEFVDGSVVSISEAPVDEAEKSTLDSEVSSAHARCRVTVIVAIWVVVAGGVLLLGLELCSSIAGPVDTAGHMWSL